MADELLGHDDQPGARAEGQLRVGHAGSEEDATDLARRRAGRQRLAVVRHLDRRTRARPTTWRSRYQNGGGNVNLTGSPDYAAAHSRASATREQAAAATSTSSSTRRRSRDRRSTASVSSRATGTCAVASRACWISSLARNIPLKGGRNVQLRVDTFNAPNSAIITGRNSSVTFTSPTDPLTVQNLPYDAKGALIPSRSLPRGAGLGVANGYQAPRTIQFQVRFSF